MSSYLGIDIGGTTIKYGIVTDTGDILRSDKIDTVFEKEALYTAILSWVKESEPYHLQGIGVSVPGFVRSDGFLKTAGAVNCLSGVHLADELQALTGLPVKVENDANCAVLAENWQGRGKAFGSYVMVTVGTGIGGGIVIRNRLLRGLHDMAGEFGFMLTSPMVSRDTLTPSLSKTAAMPSLCHYYFIQTNQHTEDGRAIFEQAENGSSAARKAVGNFIGQLAVGIYNLMTCFDPEAVLIGGAVSENELFVRQLREAVKALYDGHDLLQQITPAPILPARFLNQAGMIGAVSKFMEE